MGLDFVADILFGIIILIILGSLVYRPLSKHFPFWKELKWKPVPWSEMRSHYRWGFRIIAQHSWILYIPLALAAINWFFYAFNLKSVFAMHENYVKPDFNVTIDANTVAVYYQYAQKLFREPLSYFRIEWEGIYTGISILFFIPLYYVAYFFNIKGLKSSLHYDHKHSMWIRVIHILGVVAVPYVVYWNSMAYRNSFVFSDPYKWQLDFPNPILSSVVGYVAGVPVWTYFLIIMLSFLQSVKTDVSFPTILKSRSRSYLPIMGWWALFNFLGYIFPYHRLSNLIDLLESPEIKLFLMKALWFCKFGGVILIPLLSLMIAFIPVSIVLGENSLIAGINKGIQFCLRNLAGYLQFISLSIIPLFILSAGSLMLDRSMMVQFPSRSAWIADISKLVLVGTLSLFFSLLVSLAMFSFWWEKRESTQ